MNILSIDNEHKFLGRKAIYTSREQINENTIPSIINGAMNRHMVNRLESEYLYKYFRGDQPILKRAKTVRPEINNKIVINNAYSIVRNASGYFLGEPIQYTAKDQTDSKSIATLNAFMDSENKACEDMSVGNWCAITGRGFRLVAADEPEEVDEAPFEIPTLEPFCTEVIYSTKVGHPAVLAFTYTDILNDDGSVVGTTYTVYDDTYQYIYTVKGAANTVISIKNLISKKPHFLGDVPIVEYLNNEWRMGDFEMVLTILDALNKLHSDRVNSVEQVVNSILVFIGCHLKTAEENKSAGADGTSDLEKLKEYGAIELPNADGGKADVKYVFSQVNQNEVETLAQTLIDYVYAVTGIPDRKTSAAGTGDTGDAVFLRDGYQALEVVARVKERNFKKAERSVLKIVCNILKINNNMSLRPLQIDIRFVRNRTNNLVNKSQAAVNLQQTQIFAPEDIITMLGVTETPGEMAARGQKYWDKKNAAVPENPSPPNTGTTNNPKQEVANGNNGFGGNA